MGAGMGTMMMNQIFGGITQAAGLRAQGEFAQAASERDAELMEFQAQEAIKQGQQLSYEVRRRGKQVVGAQRAIAAAANIDVNTGSVAQAQDDARFFTTMDEITVRNNAWMEAWGYRMSAVNQRFRGRFAMSTAGFEAGMIERSAAFGAAGTFLTGAGMIGTNWGAGFGDNLFADRAKRSGGTTVSKPMGVGTRRQTGGMFSAGVSPMGDFVMPRPNRRYG
jgi:hypothetical protein